MHAIVRFNPSSGFQVEVDADGVKSAVKALSEYMEVFGGHVCGKCKSKSVVPMHNADKDGNDYYKLRCTACGAQLDFGQHRSGGTLFAKRKDADNNWLPDNGWYKWQDKQKRQNDDSSVPESDAFGF